jgi:hypothetical protein
MDDLQAPLQAPQEKQLLRCSPPGSATTSALKAAFISLLLIAIKNLL